MQILRKPTPKSAQKLLKKSVREGETIVIVGSCKVDYQGRADSILYEGERVIILKPDGTLLVHQEENREPVNWNPPGCEAEAEAEDGELKIISRRSSPKETLLIKFDNLKFAASFKLEDDEELQLIGTEEDLVDSAMQDPSLIEEGFQPIEREKKMRTGSIDIFGEDSEGKSVVIEFKRNKATLSAVNQLGRYVEELEKKLENEVRGIVAAPKITSGAKGLLKQEGLEYMKIERHPDREIGKMVLDKSQRRIMEFGEEEPES